MSQVKVVTDSTSDIAPETVSELGIVVVPLNIHFGDETLLDGVEITNQEFYERLVASRQMPTTSQANPEAFRAAFEKAVEEGAEGVVCVSVSSKLSGTYNSAMLGAREIAGVDVRVVDSRSASMALGWAAIAAAEAARDGADIDEVERVARDTAARSRLCFFADTLEYLQRNGRIGRAQSLVGSVLQVKPLLVLDDGEVVAYQRTRTRAKAIQALINWCAQLREPERMSVVWNANEDELKRLMDGLAPVFPRDQIVVSTYGPVIGVHIGPGSLGVLAVEGSRGSG
ncbi:MAG: DegV family protein [Chloroflexia bacterium]